MRLTTAQMLDRALARDAASDGLFITGVLTTGIYCLPSCPAKNPKPESIRFFTSEPEARQAGLRPCKRCRPDLFYQRRDPDLELVRSLSRQLRERPEDFPSITHLAHANEVGLTRLTQLFRQHLHLTPAAYLCRCRVEAACELLVTTGQALLEVAMTVGFASTSAFHHNFRRLTGMSPGAYRRLGERPELTIDLPPGYRRHETLQYWRRDPDSCCESFDGRTLVKAVTIDDRPVLLRLELAEQTVQVRLSAAQPLAASQMRAGHAIALRLLGLDGDPGPFERRAQREPGVARLLGHRRGLRIPQTANLVEGLTWAILGQQVNLAFTYRLRRAVTELAGTPIEGLIAHPTAADLARLDYIDLIRLKVSRRKAEYLIDIARLVTTGELDAEGLRQLPTTVVAQRLGALRGLGPWSVSYLMLRSCCFADCVPWGDAGLLRALQQHFGLAERPDRAQTEQLLAPFVPFRSLATAHLWASLAAPAAETLRSDLEKEVSCERVLSPVPVSGR